MSKEKAKLLLKRMTKAKEVYLVRRGNSAILYAFRFVKSLGRKTIIIPDQGGWLTYEQFPERVKLHLVRLKTDSGYVELDELEKTLKENPGSALILNSMSGYFVELPMKEIYNVCKKYDCILINDVSGSIGTENAKYGDIMLGSFGKYKPLELEEGGFIAFNIANNSEIEEFELDYDLLCEKLVKLKERMEFFFRKAAEIKDYLKEYDIIHRDKRGINVIVRFHDDKEKRRIIAYCDSHEFPYTECPRYIRVLEDAISIEVKRL